VLMGRRFVGVAALLQKKSPYPLTGPIQKRKLVYMNTTTTAKVDRVPFLHLGLLDIDYDVLITIIKNNEERIIKLLEAKNFSMKEYRSLSRLREIHELVCRKRGMRYPC